MQQVWIGNGHRARRLELPSPEQEVLPGLGWGCASDPVSPAYWAARCSWPVETLPAFVTRDGSLLEEIGFCLLGGYGIRYEVNAAAFDRLKEHGAFDLRRSCEETQLLELLRAPLSVLGRDIHYRFPNQRARRVSKARREVQIGDLEGLTPLALREQLQRIEGIGPKTASWIVRNLLDSDEVAILDVHVIRACRRMALFPEVTALPRDYFTLEHKFLELARGIGVRASVLDAVMWSEVRKAPN